MMNKCPECGSNIYFAENFPRVRDRLHRVEEDRDRVVAKNAAEIHNLRFELGERDRVKEGMQRKINAQSRRIRQLEKRLRDHSVFPYGERETP